MKYLIIFFFAVATLSSCGGSVKTDNKPAEVKKDSIPAKVVYTCPMHPEVVSDKPGTCPKCGMDLEKKQQ